MTTLSRQCVYGEHDTCTGCGDTCHRTTREVRLQLVMSVFLLAVLAGLAFAAWLRR